MQCIVCPYICMYHIHTWYTRSSKKLIISAHFSLQIVQNTIHIFFSCNLVTGLTLVFCWSIATAPQGSHKGSKGSSILMASASCIKSRNGAKHHKHYYWMLAEGRMRGMMENKKKQRNTSVDQTLPPSSYGKGQFLPPSTHPGTWQMLPAFHMPFLLSCFTAFLFFKKLNLIPSFLFSISALLCFWTVSKFYLDIVRLPFTFFSPNLFEGQP